MCSVGDDVFDNEAEKLIPSPKISKISDVCNKCRTEKPCIVLRTKDVYCKSCFLIGAVHKFKASLGKSRLIHPNDRVLIWHQIGHPSTALLHFLRTGLDLNTPKKLRFVPVFLFVDDQYHVTVNERLQLMEKANQEAQGFGFHLNFISFAEYVTNSNKISELLSTDNLHISDNDKEKLESVINKKTSKTNKNDIIVLLRRQLVLDVAKHYKCKFVFTPEISVDIASSLLSNISLGRGPHISIDTGFCDDRDNEVKILRPLRSFDMKELAFYNKLNNLEPLTVRQHEVNAYSSVQDLMKKFVKELQVNYPATVTTIMKTGDKLSLDKNCTEKCSLCKKQKSLKMIPLLLLLLTGYSTIDSDCPNTNKPTYTADPTNCSIYYECIRGNKYERVCPPGLLWNDDDKYCDLSEYVDCESATTKDPLCPSATDTINVEYPADCTKYYKCVKGKKEIKDCPENLYFNPKTSTCDYMDNVDCASPPTAPTSTQTEQTVTQTSPTSTTTDSPTPVDPICSSTTDTHNVVYPYDCSKYYKCIKGQSHLADCPENMLFNPDTSGCDYMDKVNCAVTVSPTSAPSTITTTTTSNPATTTSKRTTTVTTQAPANVCSGKADGTYVGDPTNCRKFYECVDGKGSSFTCPKGTIWDEPLLSCVNSDIDC